MCLSRWSSRFVLLDNYGQALCPKELDDMQAWKAAGVLFVKIHGRLEKARGRRGQAGPDLTAVRRALKGGSLRSTAWSAH